MNPDTISKKFALSILIAFSGVLWLNVWHQIGHSHEAIVGSSPILNWLRDLGVLLLPVMLAVWIGSAIAQWLGNRSKGRISASVQTALTVGFVGVLTSIVMVVVEAGRFLQTGIGNDFALMVSVCRTVNSTSFQIVDALFRNFSTIETARLHVFIQDLSTLTLANLAYIPCDVHFQGIGNTSGGHTFFSVQRVIPY